MKHFFNYLPLSCLFILMVVFGQNLSAQTILNSKKELFGGNKKPNVILILADDMGKGMISAYGQKQFKTPNIDRLIEDGISFNNSYACSYCAPSRASLLTGYSDTHDGHWTKTKGMKYTVSDTSKIAAMEKFVDAHEITLPKGDDYLAQVFNRAGYFTGEIGKLDYGFLGSRHQIKSHGWDYFYGYLDHGRCHGYYPPFLFENNKIVMIKGNTRANCGDVPMYNALADQKKYYDMRWDMKGKKHYSQDIFDKKVIEFIREHKDKPFFLYHPSLLSHGALSIPKVNKEVINNPNLNQLEKEYASMVLRLDKTVGLIYDELKKEGILDNTIIVFSSDNGHESVYYQLEGHTSHTYNLKTGEKFDEYHNKYRSTTGGDVFDGNMGMAGFKRRNLEGGVHVPLTFYWKGHFKAGERNDVVANYDFLPTIADMLNVSVTSQKDGISFLPLLLDASQTLPKNRYVLVDSYEGPAVIVNDGWKLRYTSVAGNYELFNLNDDLAEEHDLSAKYPDKVTELKSILLHHVTYTISYKGYTSVKDCMKTITLPKKKKK